jgi:hypothetical protein
MLEAGVAWQHFTAKLAHLLYLREKRDPAVSCQNTKASYNLSNVVTYLTCNFEFTGFVESSIHRIVGHRMCKSPHMRWSRRGAHSDVQLRVALLNEAFWEIAQRQFSSIE